MSDYDTRLARVNHRIERAEWSKAEAASRIGYTTASQYSYVRQILAGVGTSNVILGKIEAALDAAGAEEAEQEATP